MFAYQILLLLFMANGAPIILCRLLGGRFDWPVDFGLVWYDGHPILGPSKTWRGIAGAVLFSAATTYGLGLGAYLGWVAGLLAMLGDLASSFIKRRLGIASSGMALGLDQIPEALLPLLWLKSQLGFSYSMVFWLSCAFLVLELGISRILFWLHIRKQPY